MCKGMRSEGLLSSFYQKQTKIMIVHGTHSLKTEGKKIVWGVVTNYGKGEATKREVGGGEGK